MKEIRLQDIEGFRIGSAENSEAGTGCTVIICEQGAPCSVDVRGGGPASRESELLNPVAACDRVHAVLLSGGSAYGLDAAGGEYIVFVDSDDFIAEDYIETLMQCLKKYGI